jgi:hypothetical protein
LDTYSHYLPSMGDQAAGAMWSLCGSVTKIPLRIAVAIIITEPRLPLPDRGQNSQFALCTRRGRLAYGVLVRTEEWPGGETHVLDGPPMGSPALYKPRLHT